MAWARSTASRAARGYGADHRKLRAKLLPQAYGTPCVRCGRPMLRGQELHFDHNDDRTGYLGFSHRACNIRAAARKAKRIQTMRKRGVWSMGDRRLSVMDSSREW